MLLRDSQFKGSATYAGVQEIASEAASGDTTGYREEFLRIVAQARQVSGREPAAPGPSTSPRNPSRSAASW